MSELRCVRVPRHTLPERALTRVDVAGRQVVVALRDDKVFAFADRCPHRGAPLSCGGELVRPFVPSGGRLEPSATDSHVRCPWHKWDFDLASGRCTTDGRLRVRIYHAWFERDEVVVSLDPRVKAAA